MTRQRRFGRLQFWPWLCAWLFLLTLAYSCATDLEEAQRQFISGDYSNCIIQAQQVLQAQPEEIEWRILLAQSLLATGKYPDARAAITNALAEETRSVWTIAAPPVPARSGKR